jgi:hypothetical protein
LLPRDALTEQPDTGQVAAETLRSYRAAAQAVFDEAVLDECRIGREYDNALRQHGLGSDPEIAARAVFDQALAATDEAERNLP